MVQEVPGGLLGLVEQAGLLERRGGCGWQKLALRGGEQGLSRSELQA